MDNVQCICNKISMIIINTCELQSLTSARNIISVMSNGTVLLPTPPSIITQILFTVSINWNRCTYGKYWVKRGLLLLIVFLMWGNMKISSILSIWDFQCFYSTCSCIYTTVYKSHCGMLTSWGLPFYKLTGLSKGSSTDTYVYNTIQSVNQILVLLACELHPRY